MRITVVVADSIRDAVNTRTATRDGGVTFRTSLATPQAPTVPVAWVSSWVTKGHGARSDAKGDFDLRDEIEGHAWLANKLRTFAQDGTCTVMRSGTRIAKVYRGEEWGLSGIMADLNLVGVSLGVP